MSLSPGRREEEDTVDSEQGTGAYSLGHLGFDRTPPKGSVSGQPFRRFQVIKTSCLGLGAPQGFAVSVIPTGGTAETSSPAYHTSTLWWTKQRMYLPDSFKLLAGGLTGRCQSSARDDANVGRTKYRGWQGASSMRCDLELAGKDALHEFANEIPGQAERERFQIFSGSGRRTYHVRALPSGGSYSHDLTKSYTWKGSMSAINELDKSLRKPLCNGNLKLLGPDGKMLAVWQNRSDPRVLGSLNILEDSDEFMDDLLDAVVLSCLAIVLSERLNTLGLLGGVNKRGRVQL